MKSQKKKLIRLMLGLWLAVFLCGCGRLTEDTKIVLTTGFEEDEVFRIESMSCYMPEIMVYLTNIQNQYESVYGAEIWEKDLGGTSLEASVKETVIAQIAQIKTMNLLAERHGVTLDESELKLAAKAAEEYYGSLSETERQALGATEETICRMYSEYALAHKVYEYIIKDINPEISDDEARTITVQHILIKTYALDGTGKKIEYSESSRADAREEAEEILELARQEDSDFEELVLQYSEGETGNFSFGKGETEAVFEEAAFNLEKGEISDIVETEYGYHIIKCINTFNREETDANKIKIVEKKREEVFGQEYDVFVATLTRNLNTELWETVSLIRSEEITTNTFFEIYNQYFS
ncbi:MAG: peptidylprolyl isomerase [Lachnospiraceae bacterium]|nr:peptidylprolyl isomerase [Lachnospiraceae bacterium]